MDKQVEEQTRFADVLQWILYMLFQLFKVMAEKIREGNFCNNMLQLTKTKHDSPICFSGFYTCRRSPNYSRSWPRKYEKSHQERWQVFSWQEKLPFKQILSRYHFEGLALYSGHIMYKFYRLPCNMTCNTLLPEKYKS